MMKRISIAGLSLILILSINVEAQNTSDKTKAKTTKDDNGSKLSIGGYGEVLYRNYDYGLNPMGSTSGAVKEDRATIDIPRFIISLDYDFGSGFSLATEIEFEHGGTGSAIEYEFDEMGEYEAEIEKGGEVVLEQFHLTKRFSDAFSLRVGHIILGVGQINQHHLPSEYFTTVRPEAESSILPSTWHETGFEVFGQFRDWRYRVQVVNGLDANGFSSANWIQSGRQTKFEEVNATSLAYIGRLEYVGFQGLVFGVSGYYGPQTAKNVQKADIMKGVDGTVSLFSVHGRYKKNGVIARFNYLTGNLNDSEEITMRNKYLSKHAQYSRTPVAERALLYGAEFGYDVMRFFGKKKTPLYPFVRYDYYNSMEKTQGTVYADSRFKKEVYTVGLNWLVHSSISVKADYSMRKIDGGNYNDENTFGLAVVFNGVFK